MKPFIRRNKTSMLLDIAPLIDVMFMLLLFFILTSSFSRPSIPLKMPEASNKEKVEKEDLIISVDKDCFGDPDKRFFLAQAATAERLNVCCREHPCFHTFVFKSSVHVPHHGIFMQNLF